MSKRIKWSEILIIGLAFFATYFGAGNLIFPPMMGLQSGSSYAVSILGMALSAIFLPILTIVIIGKIGNVQGITDHVSPKLYNIFLTLSMILTMVISVPRTAAVAIEMGVRGVYSGTPYIPGVAIYFLIVFFVAKSKDNVLDKIGKYLTPVMVIILFVLIIRGVFDPLGTPVDTENSQPFFSAFLSGYQTGDVSMSFVMASIFIGTVVNKGYSDAKSRSKVMLLAGMVAFVCLLIIYGGLLYMGACVSADYPNGIGQAELLVDMILRSGGHVAMAALGVAVVLACLTTAIGQVTAIADHFSHISGNRVSYVSCESVIILVCVAIAFLGVDQIVSLTAPLFGLLYPAMIALLILAVFRKLVPNDGAWQGAFYCVVLYSAIETLIAYGISPIVFTNIVAVMPLSSVGFGWVVPFIVGLIGGSVWGIASKKTAVA